MPSYAMTTKINHRNCEIRVYYRLVKFGVLANKSPRITELKVSALKLGTDEIKSHLCKKSRR